MFLYTVILIRSRLTVLISEGVLISEVHYSQVSLYLFGVVVATLRVLAPKICMANVPGINVCMFELCGLLSCQDIYP